MLEGCTRSLIWETESIRAPLFGRLSLILDYGLCLNII